MKEYNTMVLAMFTGEAKRKKIKGRKINLGFPGLNFFYYKDDFGYYICELTSGFSAGDGYTLKEAKEVAMLRIGTTPKNELKQMIKKCIKKHGYANKEKP